MTSVNVEMHNDDLFKRMADTKIWKIAGQNQLVIGRKDGTVKYPDPPIRLPYTLVSPDFLYFTWDNNPTSSAWLGDSLSTAGWGPTSGKSAVENGSTAWLVSGSLSGSSVGWARRLAMNTDTQAFSRNALVADSRPSDATVPANIYNMLMSGGFTVAYFARAPYDFGNNGTMFVSNDQFRPVITFGTRASDEANFLFAFGFFFRNTEGLKTAMAWRDGSSSLNLNVLTGSRQVPDGNWHHYAWAWSKDNFPSDYFQWPASATYTGGVRYSGTWVPSSGSTAFSNTRAVYTDGEILDYANIIPPAGFIPSYGGTGVYPSSGSYADLLYVGVDSYSNDSLAQFECRDFVICSGALPPDTYSDGDGFNGFNINSYLRSASYLQTNSSVPNIRSRWFYNEEPIVDKLRNYPLTVRAATGSLSRIFNHTGYIEIDQLRYKENIGCLMGPADDSIARLFATGSYTIEAWLSCSNVDVNNRTIFTYGSSGTPNTTYCGRSVLFFLDGNKNLNLTVSSGANSPSTTGVFVDATMSLNTWNHVQLSVTRDPSNIFFMTASCMINGISAGTQVYRTSPFNGLSGSMWIGMKNHIIESHVTVTSDETSVWSGRIGHVKVWKHARTQAEALSVYINERHFYDDKI